MATPAVTYKYDGTGVTGGVVYSKGKLTLVSSTVSAYSYDEYDQNGRVKRCTQTTGGQPYQMSYGYDLAGNMTSETYPSGKVIATEYDPAGRIAGVKRQANGMYYAGGPVGSGAMQYAAHGAVASMRLGNGRIERTTFNNRLQPAQISLDANTVGVNTLQLDYGYGTTTNNGNVLSQTITVPKSAGGNLVLTQGYSYDALNRLATANENNGTSWSQTYDIDRWGNRAVRTSTYIPTPVLTPQSANSADFSAFDQGNNRIARTGFGYDVAGNLTGDPTTNANAMLYDGENRQTSYTKAGATTSYSYDGDGRRVKRVSGGVTTLFVYNVAGQLIAEYTSGTPAAGDTSYLTTDHLGSTRLVTDSGGNVKARYDYLPFGEEIGANIGSRSTVVGYAGTDSTKQKFTEKERDTESGLDYFGARYYASASGRFTSADSYAGSANVPQTFNLYAYALNNPLKYVDPTGHFIVEKSPFDWMAMEIAESGQNQNDGHVVDRLLAQMNQAADQAAGNFVVEGQRAIQNWFIRLITFGLAKHSYIGIPVVENGVWTEKIKYYEVLGEKGSSKNQQVRRTDALKDNASDDAGRHTSGTDNKVFATAAQREAIGARSQYFADTAQCPVCGSNYSLLFHNSNTFGYSMLSEVGIEPPRAPFLTPAYKRWGTGWY